MQMTEEAAPSARADRGSGCSAGAENPRCTPGLSAGGGRAGDRQTLGLLPLGSAKVRPQPSLVDGRPERGPERAGRGPNGPQCLRPAAPKLS